MDAHIFECWLPPHIVFCRCCARGTPDAHCPIPAAAPFGSKVQTYVDYAASGRPLPQVEAFMQQRVLPYYANTHTETSGGPPLQDFTWLLQQRP